MKRHGMKHVKLLVAMLVTMMVAMSFVGCGNSNNGTEESTPTPQADVTQEPQATEAPQEEANETTYPVVITDSFGTEVILEQEPVNVISVGPNITEMIFELGAQDKLVGRTDYCDYPTAALSIESIGTLYTPDIEKIISLEPNLVITSTHFSEENTQKLQELNIPVIAIYEEFDVTGVYSMLEILGKALNKQEAAQTIIADMKATIEETTEKVKDLEAPSVYYVVGYGDGGDFTAPANTFVGQLITLAGGANIAPESDSWSYSLESLLEADPSIIVVRQGEKEAFMATEAYQSLTAVKEDNVFEIDNNLLDRQGNRNAQGLVELATIFHPEAFQ